MFDSENPEGYNTQAESCPEFDAVCGMDDGFDCREDAYDMALLKYCAECGI